MFFFKRGKVCVFPSLYLPKIGHNWRIFAKSLIFFLGSPIFAVCYPTRNDHFTRRTNRNISFVSELQLFNRR